MAEQMLEVEYRKPIAHGTNAGYTQHIERRVEFCDECRSARRNYLRDLKARRALRPRRAPAGEACGEKRGTRAGYQRHYNAGQPSCDPCREAHADYGRVYKRNHPKPERPEPPSQTSDHVSDTVDVPYSVLGALLSSAPTEVEEWAEAQLGADIVTKAINAAGNEFMELSA